MARVHHGHKPRTRRDRMKVVGALLIAAGIPTVLFLGLSALPILVRGNQDLYDAIAQRHLQQVQRLLSQGADVNSTWRGFQLLSSHDQDRRRYFDAPPLIRAIQIDHPEIAAALIDNGADVNTRDASGIPALMQAAQQGQTAIVKLLLERGADVHATDRHGNSVLQYNADAQHQGPALLPEVHELLLGAGARK
jgi:ankyrin repeat protein